MDFFYHQTSTVIISNEAARTISIAIHWMSISMCYCYKNECQTLDVECYWYKNNFQMIEVDVSTGVTVTQMSAQHWILRYRCYYRLITRHCYQTFCYTLNLNI